MRVVFVIAGLMTVVAASCSTARRSEPIAGAFRPADAALESGEALFDRHCNKCHVGGEAGLGPGINDKPLPRFLMRIQVRLGIGAMPSLADDEISDEELGLVLAYLKALRRHPEGT